VGFRALPDMCCVHDAGVLVKENRKSRL